MRTFRNLFFVLFVISFGLWLFYIVKDLESNRSWKFETHKNK